MRSRRGVRAFSLVEVTLALGIVVFAIVPLISLMPVALSSASASLDTTRRAEIVQQISATLSQSTYASVLSTPSTFYFDSDGLPTTSGAGNVYYKVQCQAFNGVNYPDDPSTFFAKNSISLIQILTTIPLKPGQTPATNYITISNCGY